MKIVNHYRKQNRKKLNPVFKIEINMKKIKTGDQYRNQNRKNEKPVTNIKIEIEIYFLGYKPCKKY